ncbi:MAG: M24 family metallopeptidase [Armatimonadota bacterium]
MKLSRDVMVNHDEVRRALDESRMDALIAVSPENTFYFSGVLIRTQISIRERLALVVVPRQGEETFIVCNIEESLARSQGWLRDVRTYVEFAQSPLEILAQVLRERGLAEGRLGVEDRYLSAAYYRELQQQLPEADLVAADQLFSDIRNIKTPAQVELFTSAFQRTEQAVWNAWTASKPGESEKIVAERMVQEMVKAGADGPRHMTLAVGENTIHPHARPSDRALRPGDLVLTDCGAVFGGYSSDIARMGVVGKPTRAQASGYKALYDAQRETIAMMKPGVTFAQAYTACKEAFARRGHVLHNPHVGHNLSLLGGHEHPLLHPFAREPMRPGMLICVEPSLDMDAHTRMHFEDLVLITEGDPKILCWWDAKELLVF